MGSSTGGSSRSLFDPVRFLVSGFNNEGRFSVNLYDVSLSTHGTEGMGRVSLDDHITYDRSIDAIYSQINRDLILKVTSPANSCRHDPCTHLSRRRSVLLMVRSS
jgi:hypothetical protein